MILRDALFCNIIQNVFCTAKVYNDGCQVTNSVLLSRYRFCIILYYTINYYVIILLYCNINIPVSEVLYSLFSYDIFDKFRVTVHLCRQTY